MKATMTAAAIAVAATAATAQTFYSIDPSASTLTWGGGKVIGGSHEGTIKLSAGGLQLTDGAVTAGKFTIDMRTITCTDLSGEMAGKLVGHLNSDDFFSVEKFPTATLSITSADAQGNITADLTIKGKTSPVTFKADIKQASGSLIATADITFDRSKYDVRYGSDSFFDNLGDKAIKNDVTLKVALKGTAK